MVSESFKESHPYWLIIRDPLRVIGPKLERYSEVSTSQKGWTFLAADESIAKLLRRLKAEGLELNEKTLPDYRRRLTAADAPDGSLVAMEIARTYGNSYRACLNLRKLILATNLLQEERRDLWPAFTRNELLGWSKDQLTVEVQRRLRELHELPFRNNSQMEYVQKLGIQAPFDEEARFLESYIEVIDALRNDDLLTTRKDDLRMNVAQERRRRDIRFDVGIRLETNVQTIEEIQRWKKEQRLRVLADKSLATDEAEELLAEIESAVEREKQRLRSDIGIYEEA